MNTSMVTLSCIFNEYVVYILTVNNYEKSE